MDLPRGAPAEESASRDIFLSPRVVDQHAFDDFSSALRGLIERAEDRSEQLDALSERSRQLQTELAGTEQAHAETLDLASRALAQVRRRDEAAQQLLRDAEEAGRSMEAFERSTESLIERKLRSIDDRLTSLHREAAHRSGDIETRLTELLRRIDDRYTALETEAARRIEAQLDAARSRIERLPESHEARADAIEERLGELAHLAETRLGELETRVGLTIDRRLDGVRSQLDAVLTPATERGAALQRRLTETDERAEDRLRDLDRMLTDRLTPGLDKLTRLCDRAETLTGDDERGLPHLMSRAEYTVSSAEQNARRLEDACRRAHEAQSFIDDALGTWNEQIERLRRHERDTLASVASATQDADRARTDLDTRAESLREEARAFIDEMRPRFEALRDTLDHARESAERSAGVTRTTIDEAAEAHDAIEATLRRLEPWRAVLLHDDDSELPPALRRMVDGVRVDLSGDLARLADAMHAAASRTRTALDPIDEPTTPDA